MTKLSLIPQDVSDAQGGDSFPFHRTGQDTKRRTLSSLLTWLGVNRSNPYKFSAYLAVSANLADATFTKVGFDTERFDTNSNFDTTTNKGRYTAPISGFYNINAHADLTAPSTGVAGIVSLYKNGAELLRRNMGLPSSGNTASVFSGTLADLVQLTAGDYLEIYVYIDVTSGTPTVVGSSINTRFSGSLDSAT